MHKDLHPEGWLPPKGYSNGVVANGSEMIFTGGLIGWNANCEFETSDFVGQLRQTLENIVAVLKEAGAGPEHLVRMTWYITDKQAYNGNLKEIGRAYREVIGRHYPPMAVLQVVALMEDERGPMWRWSNFSMNEHTGTHMDAPAHWVSGKDIPNGTVDTMPMQSMIAPVCVIDCSKEVAADKGFILTKAFMEKWEEEHGRIPAGNWVFLRSDWRKVADPDNYTNMQEDGAHSPGPDTETVTWLIEERDVLGFGTECIGTDAGQAHTFEPPYPCHHLMHGNGRLGLQCMTNLDLLPPTGAVILATPLKIIDGSGSPLRVVGLVAEK